MFSQIDTEIQLLEDVIDEEINYITTLRKEATNSNMYIEYQGRIIGLSTALNYVRNTKININKHILEILKNTTDGNYVEKLGILEDENRVLRDKIYLLEQDLSKFDTLDKKLKKGKKNNLNTSLKEFRAFELTDKQKQEMADEINEAGLLDELITKDDIKNVVEKLEDEDENKNE